MRRARYALLGLTALSCATGENGPVNLNQTESGGTAGDSSLAGSSNPAGGADATAGSGVTSGAGGSMGGNSAAGGTVGASGTFGTAGTLGASGTFGAGGTFGTGGSGAGGTGGAGGSAAGTGGKPSGGAGAGGTAGGSGAGGAGGAPGTAKCGDHAIAASTQWVASASAECAPTCTDPNGPFTASLAIDGNAATRFATGKAQAGDEWLQIDLGATATVNHLTLSTASATDYTRHYKVRVSATSVDQAAAVLADADGAAGTLNITLSKTVNGRYVLISQTGAVVAPATSWWSVNEVTVTCQ